MDISAENFLNAKFGIDVKDCSASVDIVGNSGGMMDPPRYGNDLIPLMEEFKEINSGDDIVQALNPRSNNWVVINTTTGTIIGSFDKKLPDIPEAENKKI